MIHDTRLFSNSQDNKEILQHVLLEILTRHPDFYSLFLGHANGDLLQVINLKGYAKLPSSFQLDEDDHWLVYQITGQGSDRKQVTTYLDESLNVRKRDTKATDYDPRTRVWFQDAISTSVTKTEQYVFNVFDVPGYTYAIKSAQTGDVLAIDIASASLNHFLTAQQTKMKHLVESEMYVYRGDGEIIASSKNQSHQHSFADLSQLVKLDEQQSGLANKAHQFGKMLSVHEKGIEKYMFVLPLPNPAHENKLETLGCITLVVNKFILALADSGRKSLKK